MSKEKLGWNLSKRRKYVKSEVIQTCPNKCKFYSSNSSQDKQNLEKVVVHSGKRDVPLCKKVYGFHRNLADSDEINR